MSMTVKQARVGANLTIREMAARLGQHEQTYSKYEKHPEKMPVEMAERIAEITGVPMDDLIFLHNRSN